MHRVDAGDVTIAYETAEPEGGSGRPALLIHGFASNRNVNWKSTGWFKALTGAGLTVTAPDLRGHGRSGAVYEPQGYALQTMAEDMVRVLDAVGAEQADILGYSLGARISLQLALHHLDRCRRVVLAGVGENLLKSADTERVPRALEADDPDAVTDPVGRTFRQFAERTGSDLRALAACWRGTRLAVDPDELAAVRVPALVVVGDRDDVTGRAEPLADLIPDAELVLVPGKDHMSTVGDPATKKAVLEFWEP